MAPALSAMYGRHAPDRLASTDEVAGYIYRPEFVQPIRAGLVHSPLPAHNTGVVDQRGQGTELLIELLEKGDDLILLAKIDFHRQRSPATIRDFSRHGVRLGRV